MNNFLCQMLGYSHYICIWSNVFTKFSLEVLGHFRPKKVYTKFPMIFNYTKVLYIPFCPKMSQCKSYKSQSIKNFQLIYRRHVLRAFLPLITRFYTNFYQ